MYGARPDPGFDMLCGGSRALPSRIDFSRSSPTSRTPHGLLMARFAFFACVCLISLMQASRAERVCGNVPFVSFASWIGFGLRTWTSRFRYAV